MLEVLEHPVTVEARVDTAEVEMVLIIKVVEEEGLPGSFLIL